jgi:hypothetical protein
MVKRFLFLVLSQHVLSSDHLFLIFESISILVLALKERGTGKVSKQDSFSQP